MEQNKLRLNGARCLRSGVKETPSFPHIPAARTRRRRARSPLRRRLSAPPPLGPAAAAAAAGQVTSRAHCAPARTPIPASAPLAAGARSAPGPGRLTGDPGGSGFSLFPPPWSPGRGGDRGDRTGGGARRAGGVGSAAGPAPRGLGGCSWAEAEGGRRGGRGGSSPGGHGAGRREDRAGRAALLRAGRLTQRGGEPGLRGLGAAGSAARGRCGAHPARGPAAPPRPGRATAPRPTPRASPRRPALPALLSVPPPLSRAPRAHTLHSSVRAAAVTFLRRATPVRTGVSLVRARSGRASNRRGERVPGPARLAVTLAPRENVGRLRLPWGLQSPGE
ncbi:collagen, type I, alpha 1a-like [Cavia porcellus]|uniref:collagen, type I, alpha 1a-like n=1 Tax=Cavia porcellus TaxID=10141 RepID=UPI002FE3890B